ncbi:unnamed protein product [Parascedosporium putredinis]|uniref:Major facilitator superfamily (MFS) profile domain-containing protein n=1 Tax=Parascedosporium putredinis TaxID=1442378 RepID=A0A9P1GXH4_9PEZI|nr:unnamed protein product [Parascedosporium putredinis]CAI7989013.1 unnamed protein product [Parascedosporium putredinis]
MSGTAILCAGALLQASCSGPTPFTMMVAGRAICGIGVAIVSTSVPLYQSEISPARERGKFVTMNHIGFIVGLAMGLWVGYFMTFWTGETGDYYGWRISLLLQLIPALTFGFGLPFVPESPRWLVENGQVAEAATVLCWLREGSFTHNEVDKEVSEMVESVEEHRHSGLSWKSLFIEPPLFARMWRAALLHFLAQMCGAAAMKYYLPTLLKALGLSRRLALMAGAIEMTLKVGCSVIEMLIIDRLGRRLSLIIGCLAMALGMLVNGVLPLMYPENKNRIADAICIFFIFIYAFGYSLGFGPAAWLYGSETTAEIKQKEANGIHAFGSNIYFFFLVVNILCIPLIYCFYPETKGRSLENMDELFGKLEVRRLEDISFTSSDGRSSDESAGTPTVPRWPVEG